MFIPTIEVGILAMDSFFLHAHTNTTHSVSTLVEANSFMLSDGAFLPTIQSQGTDEQREKWIPLIRDYRVIGAYAQTEMGHGKCIFASHLVIVYHQAWSKIY